MLLGLFVLSSVNNLKVFKTYKTKAVKNIGMQDKFVFRLTFIILG